MEHYDYDVIVVGGGPSGVIAAISVARAGYTCALLDKKPKQRIGDKNCGDALDKDYTDILSDKLDIEPPSVKMGEARDLISKVRIAAGDLETCIIAGVPGYQVDRLAYGQRLLRIAEETGVIVLPECPVRGIILEDNFVKGVSYVDIHDISHPNNQMKNLRAKITIDASGYIGTVRKHLPKEMTCGIDLSISKRWTVATYREIIELPREHEFREEIVLWYHDAIAPPGYAWIFTEGERMLNIGITWVKTDVYPKEKSLKQIYREVFQDYFNSNTYKVIHKGGGNIPARVHLDTMVGNGVIITGDAAGLADPTTFEGHGPALESGRVAGKVATDCLKKGSYTIGDLWPYNKSIAAYPGRLHAQSFLAAQSLRQIGVSKLSFLLGKELIRHKDLQEIFVHGTGLSRRQILRIIIRAFPRWDLLIKLKMIVNRIDKIAAIYQQYPNNPEELADWIDTRNKVLGFTV